ncbi:hypothetical protein GDO81_026063, partial [Engystomops pustulosus]
KNRRRLCDGGKEETSRGILKSGDPGGEHHERTHGAGTCCGGPPVMAVTVEWVTLLLLSLLDIQWTLCQPGALCPHTTFYHGCWIRRFPGLFLSFSGSQQRGARVLQRRPEPTAQLCSRQCCHQESCNVAVFYSGTSADNGDCHLVHCPEPESCLLHLQEHSVLYTVTAGE